MAEKEIKLTKKEHAEAAVIPAGCSMLLSVNQVAAILDFAPRTVHAMISAGEYPPADLRISVRPRWKVATHNAWVETQCLMRK